jgi:hypothetical protein
LVSKSAVGKTSHRVTNLERFYGNFLSRVDQSVYLCIQCVKVATNQIYSKCAPTLEGIVWYNHCLLRYSNQDIYSDDYTYVEVRVPVYRKLNVIKSSIKGTYTEALNTHLNQLRDNTTKSNKRYKTETLKLNDV